MNACPVEWGPKPDWNRLILVEGNSDPLDVSHITEDSFYPITEKPCNLFDSLDGIKVIGEYTAEDGKTLPIVSFLYHKIKNGKVEVTERVIAVTGITYGVHEAHAGQPSTHYITGVQIGTLDPVTGQVTLAEPSDKPVAPNNYSLDCIVGGSCGDNPVLANGGPEQSVIPPERNLPVEPLQYDDIEQLRPILFERLDTKDEEMNGLGTTRSEHVITRLRASLEKESLSTGKFFVIKDEKGKALGVFGVRSIEPPPDDKPPLDAMQNYVTTEKTLEIVNVYVAKGTAREGLGGKLVKHVVDWARREQYEEIVLNSGPRYAKRSWPFWNKHFACIDICEDYYGEGGHAPVWRIKLDQRTRPSSLDLSELKQKLLSA